MCMLDRKRLLEVLLYPIENLELVLTISSLSNELSGKGHTGKNNFGIAIPHSLVSQQCSLSRSGIFLDTGNTVHIQHFAFP